MEEDMHLLKKENYMCYNCGCWAPDDSMGNGDNITTETFSHIAKKWKKSTKESKELVLKWLEDPATPQPELEEIFDKAAKAWGQSVEKAKEETLSLLKYEMTG